jgi:hypothetical protein
VAVNQVRFNLWNYIVYHLSLECEGQIQIVITASGVNALAVKKDLVFCEMQSILGQNTAYGRLIFL